MLFLGLPDEISSCRREVEHMEGAAGTFIPSARARLSYAQSLVGIGATRIRITSEFPFLRPLPTLISYDIGDGVQFQQRVMYEGLLNQCLFCRRRGHFIRDCPSRHPRAGNPHARTSQTRQADEPASPDSQEPEASATTPQPPPPKGDSVAEEDPPTMSSPPDEPTVSRRARRRRRLR